MSCSCAKCVEEAGLLCVCAGEQAWLLAGRKGEAVVCRVGLFLEGVA